MNTQHTKGPWYKRFQGNEIEIKAGIYTIAMVHDFSGDHNENIANALLIQSAPDLYDLLLQIVKKTEDAYNKELAYASEFNNNTPGVGQSIQYAVASPLPSWFATAKNVLSKASSEL